MLLEEFDPTMRAVINPDAIHSKIDGFPETIVSVFSYHLFSRLVELLKGKVIAYTKDVDGEWPVYRVNYKGKFLAFGKARLGGPACTGYFEDLLAMGGKRIILTGNCGVLDKTIEDCAIIIPLAAIRDEGTSYHYAPPSDIIKVNRKYAEEFKRICNEQGYPTVEGTTWTTDVFYRETPKKAAARKKQGAICVEMECASMQAMCDFRGAEFFQYLYAGDNLDLDDWDQRSLNGDVRLDDKEKIALLAFELAAAIS